MGTDGAGDASWGYYLREKHQLIRRHYETIALDTELSGLWELRIDFELPRFEDAGYRIGGNKDPLYLFPLIYLKKSDPRIRFRVHEESCGPVPFPTRAECDAISASAIRQALESLGSRTGIAHSQWDHADLEKLTRAIPAAQPLIASFALQELEEKVGLIGSDRTPSAFFQRTGELMVSSGLSECLEMLVEHTLLWVTLRGQPHEQRSIVVSQEISLSRRSLTRWSFGRLPSPAFPRIRALGRGRLGSWPGLRQLRELHRRRRRSRKVLEIGAKRYGRRDLRFSFSALAERIGRPLVCLPFETILPTIYTKRCRSYHFEVRPPPARTPRDVRISFVPSLAEPAEHDQPADPPEAEFRSVRRTLTSRAARIDLPRAMTGKVTAFRITIGIGDGAFPVLWFLATAITATMLWVFAASHPRPNSQVASGILLTVPALVAGLAVGSNEVHLSELPGGSRLLLLIAGISTVIAAAALAGASPFEMKPQWMWAGCAIAATAVSVPLATSWLLSRPIVWRRLKALDTLRRQRLALGVGVVLGTVLTGILAALDKGLIARGLIAGTLLLLTVAMSTLASNRAALPMNRSRHYIGLSYLLVGVACLALACIELCAIVKHGHKRLQDWGERGALIMLLAAWVSGDVLNFLTSRAKPRDDEVHVTPDEGRKLLAKDSVRVLPILFERERRAGIRIDGAQSG